MHSNINVVVAKELHHEKIQQQQQKDTYTPRRSNWRHRLPRNKISHSLAQEC